MDEAKELVALVVEKLKHIREEKKISRYRLAKETGLSTSGLRHMEMGEVTPTLYSLILISKNIGTDLAAILTEATVQLQGRGGR